MGGRAIAELGCGGYQLRDVGPAGWERVGGPLFLPGFASRRVSASFLSAGFQLQPCPVRGPGYAGTAGRIIAHEKGL